MGRKEGKDVCGGDNIGVQRQMGEKKQKGGREGKKGTKELRKERKQAQEGEDEDCPCGPTAMPCHATATRIRPDTWQNPREVFLQSKHG